MNELLVALIAATPPTIASVLGYLASRRSLRRSVGAWSGVPLVRVLERFEKRVEAGFDRVEARLDRVDGKIDRLGEIQARTGERVARLEAEHRWPGKRSS